METRWFLLEDAGSSVPLPFLVVVVFWPTRLFVTFGLFAPRNATVIAILLICVLSVAAATFLIVEMDQPFIGLTRISNARLGCTLFQLGQ